MESDEVCVFFKVFSAKPYSKDDFTKLFFWQSSVMIRIKTQSFIESVLKNYDKNQSIRVRIQ